MPYLRSFALLACSLATLWTTGCCCIQGGAGGSCGLGACGAGPVASCGSCQGGCGEVYVDEWISHPPVVDPCCGPHSCRPVRSLLAALWGNPYHGGCGCGSSCGSDSCDGNCGYESAGYVGCSTCGGEMGVPVSGGGCNCGGGEAGTPTPVPMVRHGASFQDDGRVVHHTTAAPARTVTHTAPSSSQRTRATVTSHRVNPALQKLESARSY